MRMRLSLKYDDQTNLAVYHRYQPVQTASRHSFVSRMAEHICDTTTSLLFGRQWFYVIGHDHVAHGESVSTQAKSGLSKMPTLCKPSSTEWNRLWRIARNLSRIAAFSILTAWVWWQPKGIASCFRTISKVVLSGADIGSLKYGLKSLTKFMMWFKQPTSTCKCSTA